MKKRYFLILLFASSLVALQAQDIHVEAKNEALNNILIDVRDNYNLNVSFDDNELAKYKVTLSKTFHSPDEVFSFLIKDLPLSYEKFGEVYLIIPKKEDIIAPLSFKISGAIQDSENSESLPFTHVEINGIGGISDEYGNFNFQSKSDSVFQIRVSHLGYHILDTVLYQGFNKQIKLYSASVKINEILIQSSPSIYFGQTGSKAGFMRINHKIAQLIPGNGDNSIFNLLRLQPGFLAAGEQSNEMIIWGSYEGQSQVNFDGITLFGLKNYDDNISVVNPFMAKDIRINKGGFDATLGERVGGIVDITGIDGNKQTPGFNLNLNNTTLNILAETPIGNKNSIVGAYRQTYYNLYSPDDLTINSGEQSHIMENGIAVNPNYQFRDGNLKFSGYIDQGDSYGLSSFWGQDHFNYIVEQTHQNSIIDQKFDEKNLHYGAKVNYNKVWKGIGSSEINIAYSGLQTEVSDMENSSNMMMSQNMHNKDEQIENDITELKVNLTNKLRIYQRNEFEFGGGLIHNTTLLKENASGINTINQKDQGDQLIVFLQDRFSPIKKLDFIFGLRTNYSLGLKQFFIQPRLGIAIKPTEAIQFNASWGLYNQFIMRSSILDQYNNYKYIWILSDGKETPVLSSQHMIIGGVYNQKGFTFSVESYYKKTSGITRIIIEDSQNTSFVGESKAFGVDFFIKQEYKGHSAWISYTLSKTLERFPYFESSSYESAQHDQRHEIKLSTIINLSPFYISANYVYGSGFLLNENIQSESLNRYPYRRFDISGIYRFSLKNLRLETGISILNLFNRENIKYTNITQIPTDEMNTVSIYSGALPFTPTLFLNITF